MLAPAPLRDGGISGLAPWTPLAAEFGSVGDQCCCRAYAHIPKKASLQEAAFASGSFLVAVACFPRGGRRHRGLARVRAKAAVAYAAESLRRRDCAAVGGLLGSSFPLPGFANIAQPPVPLDVGLGTCCLKGAESEQQVAAGLRAGYRLLDTASHYENEAEVAKGIKASGLARSDVMIVAKIWFDDMGEAAAGAIRDSLERLGTDHVDLLLMHFPGSIDAVQSPATNRQRRLQTWRAMEAALDSGAARAIGVANFCRRHLKELLGYCRVPPAVCQLEIHPYFQQLELVDYCLSKGVQPMAFSPLAHGELGLLENKVLCKIAAAHGKTPAQVTLRWLLQRGIPPVMFSSSPLRLKENRDCNSFSLTEEEMAQISFLDGRGSRGGRVGFDPNLIA